MDEVAYMVRLADGREFGPAPMPLVLQWIHERRVPPDAVVRPLDGAASRAVSEMPELRRALQQAGLLPPDAPPTAPDPHARAGGDETVSRVIPYKNAHALVGYYVSIGSLIPFLGLLAGPAAIVLGIMGVRRRLRDPKIHGLAHAWIAIILGAVGTLITVGCLGPAMLAALSRSGRP